MSSSTDLGLTVAGCCVAAPRSPSSSSSSSSRSSIMPSCCIMADPSRAGCSHPCARADFTELHNYEIRGASSFLGWESIFIMYQSL
jgi:hypothetical protein